MPALPTEWLIYTNQSYLFTVRYPNTYVLLEPANPADPLQAARVFQARFQDQQIASGPLAAMEPARFQIDVFDNSSGRDLAQWLDDHAITGQRADASVGGQAGLRVTLMTMQAPNLFYYVARGAYVYRLTPLGPLGEQMLASFGFV
ncbi:MAG TPA: hypothetical protein VFS21_39670 [Roseiflexaceae bacterium]|nr:hypothetical protein [Roseiflexaceae bacterium]